MNPVLSTVKTKILIISDTHGLTFPNTLHPNEAVDVAIHCGDLTQHSTLAEFTTTLSLLDSLHADLKLFIAGNHDFSLDDAAFRAKLAEASLPDDLVRRTFGNNARDFLRTHTNPGLVFLDEGHHSFRLNNSAQLNLYATPYTPDTGGGWGFQHTQREFDINRDTDIVISHGPPYGILDMDDGVRRSCASLFKAIATAQPRVHCFGHIHGGWGSRYVTWKKRISEVPSHFTDIEHAESRVLASLRTVKVHEGVRKSSHCLGDEYPAQKGATVFVNAASMGDDGGLSQMAHALEMELPRAGDD